MSRQPTNFTARCVLFLGALCIQANAAELSREDARIVGREAALEALRFSVVGDLERRDRKLAVAIVRDADCELAHWHLGNVRWHGQWLSLPELESALAADATQQDYLRRRDSLNGDPKLELKLARWCAGRELEDWATYHYRQVLRNPASPPDTREDAAKRLGLRFHQGKWFSQDHIDHAQQAAAARQQAVSRWSSRVQRWAKTLEQGNQRRIQFARNELAKVDDLEIIPVLEQYMSAGEVTSSEAVAWLSHHPQSEATQSLLRFSLDSEWPSVKQAATSALAERPPHDFVPPLLGQLVPPIESKFSVRLSRFGGVLHRHELHRAGRTANEVARADYLELAWTLGRVTVREPDPTTPRRNRARLARRPDGGRTLSAVELAEELRLRTKWLAFEASLRTAMIEKNVAQANQLVADHNQRIYDVLDGTTEGQVADNPEAWWDWWDTYNEQYAPPKDTRYSYSSATEFSGPIYDVSVPRCSCFAAGTLVRTDAGLRPVEAIQPGHRVLSQDVVTGELAYHVVKAKTERPPSPLLEISAGETQVLATKGHPFWVNGKGWRMAKRLEVGDVLHTLDGPRAVTHVITKEPARAHNLLVDGFATYFVGANGVLVHDNQPRQPTLALTPGLVAR